MLIGIADPSSRQFAGHIWTWLVHGVACHEAFIAQWLEHPDQCAEGPSSIPVGDLDIFLCPALVTWWSHLFLYHLIFFPWQLFPYHLSDVIVKGLRITPFSYYCSIMENIMSNERSYDSLPNFTAADCESRLLSLFLEILGTFSQSTAELMNFKQNTHQKQPEPLAGVKRYCS